MGTITITVDDDTEKRFREAAKKKLGERKGYLGKATTEALEIWVRKQTQEALARDALALLETGLHTGRRLYTERKDIYDRATGSY
jgi:predicted transcriptional regulator